jgi:hypothetical protein
MFQPVQDGRTDAIDDTLLHQAPSYQAPSLEIAYRRLLGQLIVTIALAALVVAEAWLFVSPAAPHAIPA